MRAPPFKQRLETAIAAGKAAGAARVKLHPDGTVELDLVKSENGEANDFDSIPPKVPRRKHINNEP